jgi:hypothetical protein
MNDRRMRRSTAGHAASRAAILVLSALALALPSDAAALSSIADAGNWVTDGAVMAIAHGAGRTFIGGNFTHVGPRTGGGAPLGSGGAVAGPFPEVVGGSVYATAADGAGGWFVGGDFTSIGGVPDANFAHVMSDGSVDPKYDAQVKGGAVRAITVSDAAPDAGVVYLGGDFKQVRNTGRDYLAALDTDGNLVTAWNPKPDNTVLALAETHMTLWETADEAGGTSVQPIVFAGGTFTKIGANSNQPTLNSIAAIWGVGASQPAGSASTDVLGKGFALSWNPGITSGAAVRALAAGSTNEDAGHTKVTAPVYAGGDFASPTAGLMVKPFAMNLAPSGSPATRTMATSGLPSYPSAAAGCPAAAVDCAPIVRALALAGSKLYVGGDFGQLKNSPRIRLAAVTAIQDASQPSGLDLVSDFTPSADAAVRALVADTHGNVDILDDTLYAAGDFDTIGKTGAARNGLAAIDAAGEATDWNPRAAGGTSNALALGDGKVYAGGSFTSLGSTPVDHLAALDADGALDVGWPARADGPVSALALSADQSTLYVGGGFTNIAGQDQAHIAALNAADGTLQDGFKPSLDGWPLAIEPAGNRVYIGGTFTKHAEALSSANGSVLPWDPGVDDTVRAIDLVCDTVYLGGRFTNVGGKEHRRIAAVRAADASVKDWAPGDLGVVHAIVDDGSSLYVGGDFLTMGSAIRRGLAKIDLAGGATTSWNPSPGGSPIVRALALSPDGRTVYAAGEFLTMDGKPRRRLAAIDAVGGAVATDSWDPSLDDRAFALAVSGDAVYVGGEFRQTARAVQQGFASFNAAGATTGPAPATGCPDDQTPTSAPTPTPAPIAPSDTPVVPHHDLPALKVMHFRLKPARFRVARPGATRTATGKRKFPLGSAFVFDLTRRAAVRITIHRELFGRRNGRDCVAGTKRKRGKRCTLYQIYGTLRPRDVRAGHNSVAFSGMFGGKSLPAGIYTAKLVASVNHGVHTVSRLARFQVIRS